MSFISNVITHTNWYDAAFGVCLLIHIQSAIALALLMAARYQKVGGLHFFRLGRVQVSVCIVRVRPPVTIEGDYVVTATRRIKI